MAGPNEKNGTVLTAGKNRRASWNLSPHEMAVKQFAAGRSFGRKVSKHRRSSIVEVIKEKGSAAASLQVGDISRMSIKLLKYTHSLFLPA